MRVNNSFKSFLFLFLCSLTPVAAQIPDLINRMNLHEPDDFSFHTLELDKKIHKHIRIRQQDTIVKPLIMKGVRLDDLPNPTRIHHFKTKNKHYLINVQGTGQMYDFDPVKSSIERLDETFFRGHNFLPIQFYLNDTIYSFGGAGFWHSHNILTFFEKKSKGWEQYYLKNKGPERFNARIGGFNYKNQKIYTVQLPDIYEDQKSEAGLVYTLDMKTKTWEFKGRMNKLPDAFWEFDRLETRWVAPLIFSKDDQRYFIDPEANKIYEFKARTHFFTIRGDFLFSKNNYLYRYFQKESNPKGLSIDSMSIKEFIANSTVVGSFYAPPSIIDLIDWPWTIASVCLMLLLWVLIKYRTVNHKIKQLAESTYISPPDYAHEFLRFIVKNPENICSTLDLNEILNVGDRSIESQRQSRSKFINSLNFYLLSQFGIENGIERLSSSNDKRFVYYKPNTNLLIKLLKDPLYQS